MAIENFIWKMETSTKLLTANYQVIYLSSLINSVKIHDFKVFEVRYLLDILFFVYIVVIELFIVHLLFGILQNMRGVWNM